MISLTVDRIAAGGEGVGRLPDGRTVFVARTAPGEAVEVEIRTEKPRYARGRLTRVVTPSPDRVDPPCVHYVRDRCGGCQLQHLAYPAQLEAKRRIVGDALRRIGRLDVADPEITPAPAEWRYRSKLTLAAREATIGLHVESAPDTVFPLADCLITNQALMDLWAQIRRHTGLLPQKLEGLVLRQDREGNAHVVVLGGTPPWAAEPLARALPAEVSIWWRPEAGAARMVHGRETGYPALAFEQVNPALAGAIRSAAVAWLGDVSGQVVWDLFGGSGDTARLLAAAGARVWSVDADRSAIEWAERQQARGGPGQVTYVAGRVEDVLHRLPVPSAVVLNPPRTGAESRVTKHLVAAVDAGLRRVSYVSCDPATLARDLVRMPRLALVRAQAYDLFPQTAHVEALAELEAA